MDMINLKAIRMLTIPIYTTDYYKSINLEAEYFEKLKERSLS